MCFEVDDVLQIMNDETAKTAFLLKGQFFQQIHNISPVCIYIYFFHNYDCNKVKSKFGLI